MAGLKQTILDDLPVSFWTFDFDKNFINNDQIVDEIGNQNPMICQNDINGKNYELEQQSLNPIETADQYALSVAINGKVGGEYLQQFFEVVHTTAYNFDDNGEFTVEFLYFKEFPSLIKQAGEPGAYQSIKTPLVKKGSVVDISITDVYSSTDRFDVTVLGRTITMYPSDYDLFDRVNHVIVTYNVEQTDVNEYESTITLYMNGRVWGTDTETHVDTVPVTATSASWLFCGDGGSDPATDYASEKLTMDQIAIYPYALLEEQAMNHYRKTKQYSDLIKDDKPSDYWRLQENHDQFDATLVADIGGMDGEYHGNTTRGVVGPDRLVASKAAFFQVSGVGYIEHKVSSRFVPILNTSASYSLEFWFKTGGNNRALIFDSSEEAPQDWHGLRVYINSKNDEHTAGNLQVNHTSNHLINSLDFDANEERLFFNDDEWHHLAIRHNDTSNIMELFLDGELHGGVGVESQAIGAPGQIMLMGSRPGDMPIEGSLSEMAFYEYPLSDGQIYNRWVYATRYTVSGYTLLQGAPVEARLRFYDTITGALMHEVLSSPITGEYIYHPYNNRYLDVLSTLPESNTTRYRVHGPVKPAEYPDSNTV